MPAAWTRFWFQPADPINIAVIRVITGCALLWTHLTTLPDLMEFIGPDALVDREALREIRHLPFDPQIPTAGLLRSGDLSIWYYVEQPWLIWMIHALFLIALVCFTVGLFSRTTSVMVWLGHLSYIQRATLGYFGFDAVIVMLTFYLIFAPTGAQLSLDCALGRIQTTDSQKIAANVVMRLIQIHLCIIYLASGLAKVYGFSWRHGSAVYNAIHMTDVAVIDLGRLGLSEATWRFVSRAGSFFTIAVEMGFPLLIWIKRLRPVMLAATWMFQLGIGILLCLGSFQAAMFAATMAFVPSEWLLGRRVLNPDYYRRPSDGRRPMFKA